MTTTQVQYDYDVALSYASEDRIYADALATTLQSRSVKVFYDKFEKSTLWGQNLYTYLSDLYENKARFCVIFLSHHYATKAWTNHEREAAQARAFREKQAYILPIRLDDSVIPALLTTIAYLDWHQETAETVADLILEKLHRTAQTSSPTVAPSKVDRAQESTEVPTLEDDTGITPENDLYDEKRLPSTIEEPLSTTLQQEEYPITSEKPERSEEDEKDQTSPIPFRANRQPSPLRLAARKLENDNDLPSITPYHVDEQPELPRVRRASRYLSNQWQDHIEPPASNVKGMFGTFHRQADSTFLHTPYLHFLEKVVRHKTWLLPVLASMFIVTVVFFSLIIENSFTSTPFLSFTHGQTFPIQVGGNGNTFNVWESAPQQVTVPNLIGLTYQKALHAAQSQRFTLKIRTGSQSGTVKGQSPRPSAKAPNGSIIYLDMTNP